MKILQVLPRMAPTACGVSDHSWALAKEMRETHGIESTFLTAGILPSEGHNELEFEVRSVTSKHKAALQQFVEKQNGNFDAILLHFSPYGFQKRAVPNWLMGAWRSLSNMRDRPRLICMFHELYSSGPATTSAFWLQPIQKKILRGIASASDDIRTSLSKYASWLANNSGHDLEAIATLPIFSNLGEPNSLKPWRERGDAMAMFGAGIHSGESLQDVVKKAASECEKFGLSRLHIIGGKDRIATDDLPVRVQRYGHLPAESVSLVLSDCRMAYTAYSPTHFGKSSFMAAFAAHGLAVITQGNTACLPDGLEHGVNMLNEKMLTRLGENPSDVIEQIGNAARNWYEPHSIANTALGYATDIRAGMSK